MDAYLDLDASKPYLSHHQKIVALVIGINDYHGQRLNNAVADAKAVCKKLRSKGVHVIEAYNCDYDELKQKEAEYLGMLGSGCVGIIFFAGHGVEYNNLNRLIPKTVTANIHFQNDTLCAQMLLMRYAKSLSCIHGKRLRLSAFFHRFQMILTIAGWRRKGQWRIS